MSDNNNPTGTLTLDMLAPHSMHWGWRIYGDADPPSTWLAAKTSEHPELLTDGHILINLDALPAEGVRAALLRRANQGQGLIKDANEDAAQKMASMWRDEAATLPHNKARPIVPTLRPISRRWGVMGASMPLAMMGDIPFDAWKMALVVSLFDGIAVEWRPGMWEATNTLAIASVGSTPVAVLTGVRLFRDVDAGDAWQVVCDHPTCPACDGLGELWFDGGAEYTACPVCRRRKAECSKCDNRAIPVAPERWLEVVSQAARTPEGRRLQHPLSPRRPRWPPHL